MPDLIADLYRQNEWANLTLIDFCRGLSNEQLDAAAVGTVGSIRETLQHIIAAETGYLISLGATDVERLNWEDAEAWPGFDRLAELAHATAAAVTRMAPLATDEPVAVDTASKPSHVEPSILFVQMVHHGAEHRGQIKTILTTLGLEPPDLSGWSWGAAVARVRCGTCGGTDHYGEDH